MDAQARDDSLLLVARRWVNLGARLSPIYKLLTRSSHKGIHSVMKHEDEMILAEWSWAGGGGH